MSQECMSQLCTSHNPFKGTFVHSCTMMYYIVLYYHYVLSTLKRSILTGSLSVSKFSVVRLLKMEEWVGEWIVVVGESVGLILNHN